MKVISNERFLKSSFDILTKREKGSFHSYTYSFALSMIYLTFHIQKENFFYRQFNYLQERKRKETFMYSFIHYNVYTLPHQY